MRADGDPLSRGARRRSRAARRRRSSAGDLGMMRRCDSVETTAPVARRPFFGRSRSLLGLLGMVVVGACAPAAVSTQARAAHAAEAMVGDPMGGPIAESPEGPLEPVREEPPVYSSAAREVWLDAARASDWDEVASRIDGLAEADRREPGTRYVRALAARRLGDCGRALTELDGLAEALPLLESEIDDIRAECQLSVGPFDSTASDLMNRVSLEGRLEAARSWERAGQLERARALAEAILGDASDGQSERDDTAYDGRAPDVAR